MNDSSARSAREAGLMNDHAAVHSVYIVATPEEVWAALTRPESTRRYFDFLEGVMEVDSTWRVGDPVVYRTLDGTTQIEGAVLDVQPPTLLSTTLSLLYMPQLRDEPPSRLTWTMAPMGEVTKVTVAHDRIERSPESAREAVGALPSILGSMKVVLETGKPRRFKSIVIDCEAPDVLAVFWAEVLGYAIAFANEGLASLVDPRGLMQEVEFQRVRESKTVKNRLHFDLVVDDVDADRSHRRVGRPPAEPVRDACRDGRSRRQRVLSGRGLTSGWFGCRSRDPETP